MPQRQALLQHLSIDGEERRWASIIFMIAVYTFVIAKSMKILPASSFVIGTPSLLENCESGIPGVLYFHTIVLTYGNGTVPRSNPAEGMLTKV